MPTIKDVASEAGVSITTVSRVMNKRGYISEVTYKKVYDAIEKLNYHPNFRAKAFSSKRTNLIGLILPYSAHPFFAEMIMYIEQYAFEKGYSILLCNSINNVEKERIFIKLLQEKRVDGLIIGSHNLETKDYENINEPIVTFERYVNKRIPFVTCDNYTGGMMATRHLIECGCKNLIYIASTLKLDVYANQRLDGFKHVAKKMGVNYKIFTREDMSLEYDEGYRFIEEVVSENLDKFDGVFCSSDMMAYALYNFCKSIGKKVPEELKIVGFDNDKMTRYIKEPRLTTIAQPINKICEALVDNLLSVIDGEDRIMNVQLGVELIEGTTT